MVKDLECQNPIDVGDALEHIDIAEKEREE